MSNETAFDLKAYLEERRVMVDRALHAIFPSPEGPAAGVVESMTYSLFAGGKRLRPILCIAGAEAVEGRGEDVLAVACALECIHTYSLIHDDLPVMDDDDLRRGKPTNHTVFGEALALLAGDGLLTEAFVAMTRPELVAAFPAPRLLQVIGLIADAAGFRGMVGGQVVDIRMEGEKVDLETLDFIHRHKTGALITASVLSGAVLCGAGPSEIKALESYGQKVGMAFQISDDILDVEGDREIMGKPVGSDESKHKATYPALLGLAAAKEARTRLVEEAIRVLADFGPAAEPLRGIARYIIQRNK